MHGSVVGDELCQQFPFTGKKGKKRFGKLKIARAIIGKPLEYDPKFKGPLKNRSCTDVICLLIFVVFIVCWVAIGIWAIKNGNPETLLVPRDSQGRRCGLDVNVKDKPYLFFFDLTKCLSPAVPFTGCDTPQVCVKNCPRDFFLYDETLKNNSIALPFCVEGTTEYDSTKCPTWFLQSESFQKRCIPTLGSVDNETLNKIAEYVKQKDNFVTNMYASISNIKILAQAEQVAEQVIADVISAWWKILIGIALALLACIIYILMLRWIAGVMVWISIIGAVAALTAASYFSFVQWRHWLNLYNDNPESGSYKMKRNLFLTIFIIAVTILIIVLLILIFLRKRISLAIALVKEGSKAVSSVTSVLFFPILPWVLQLGVVAYAVCVGVYLATTGEVLYQVRNLTESCKTKTQLTVHTTCFPDNFTKPTDCSEAVCKFVGMDKEAFYPYLQAYNIFGFFWLAFFVSALGQMVLAQVFAQWYWTLKKSALPFFSITAAFYRTIRYHIGTLAFGSLIIAICRMIRVCLEYIDHKLKKYDNELVKAILCCMKCFFWCLEKFLKFINKNAYIMCAVHGKNFCASAKDAFMLLMRNILRVFVLDKVTDFLFFLSKVLVTVGVGAVAYVFFATDLIPFMNNSQLNFGVVPVIIIMIVTYLVASLFFSVYSMAVDTLFLCFLEDCERNDGTTSKPYYMSKNLMKIFGKRNKQA